jgi:hypothetical protein
VNLPAGDWRDVLTDRVHSGRATLGGLTANSGIALLERI